MTSLAESLQVLISMPYFPQYPELETPPPCLSWPWTPCSSAVWPFVSLEQVGLGNRWEVPALNVQILAEASPLRPWQEDTSKTLSLVSVLFSHRVHRCWCFPDPKE